MNKHRIVPILLCFSLLTGCGECKHPNLIAADCLTAAHCPDCEYTEGEPLGHDWQEANCLHPKTCDRCGETEGEIGKDCTTLQGRCAVCGNYKVSYGVMPNTLLLNDAKTTQSGESPIGDGSGMFENMFTVDIQEEHRFTNGFGFFAVVKGFMKPEKMLDEAEKCTGFAFYESFGAMTLMRSIGVLVKWEMQDKESAMDFYNAAFDYYQDRGDCGKLIGQNVIDGTDKSARWEDAEIIDEVLELSLDLSTKTVKVYMYDVEYVAKYGEGLWKNN